MKLANNNVESVNIKSINDKSIDVENINKEQCIYNMWLSGAPFLGARSAYRVYQEVGNGKEIFQLSYSEMKERTDVALKGFKMSHSKLTHETFNQYKEKIDQYQVYYNKVLSKHVRMISIESLNFPKKLHQLADCPLVIYGKGDFSLPDLSIGIVGARRCSNHGKKVAYELAKELSQQGVNIISGLAYGIDIASHRGALAAGGFTTAVLGGGLQRCYPDAHQKEFDEISQNGLVLSEEPYGKKTEAYMFPKRNRIISCLSDGIIVVEAAKKSGSLITVDFALEQGRDVFSVPGRLYDAVTEGSNELIRNGAKAVYSIEDIMSEYKEFFLKKQQYNQKNEKKLDEMEKIVYSCISYDPIHQESIMFKIQDMLETQQKSIEFKDDNLKKQIQIMERFTQADVLINVLSLELKGVIVKKSGCYYARSEV